MKISKRLKEIGDLVDSNSTCLDVGCDHAFLDIYLVKKDVNIKCIASDINKGPLDQALKNITEEHLEKKIELRLGNGLSTYTDDIDTIIISGMGGRGMIGIFKNDLKILKKVKTIILSPNNYQEDVKRFLVKIGFYIDSEKLVKDGKIIYQVIKFRRGRVRYSRKEYFFGPCLLKNKPSNFIEYFSRELKSREILLAILPKNYRLKKFLLKREIAMLKEEL